MPDLIEQHDHAQAAGESGDKTRHGQFFTMVSPFANPPFRRWLAAVSDDAVFVEPFAGANNLVRMVDELRPGLEWFCYDIEPRHPDVVRRDVIADYPTTPRPAAVVTNPPYLAKNVARREGHDDIAELCGRYDNLYKVCLERCLVHSDWVAAIIPESFVTANEFRLRLHTVVSLDRPMFVDTEVPVCLALWGVDEVNDFEVWKGERLLGTWRALQAHRPRATSTRVRFNDPHGKVGLLATDTPKRASIEFCPGERIDSGEIKHSSRHRSRITIDRLSDDQIPALLEAANRRLADLRTSTCDVGLTAFMGTRDDGWYRRRLDFATARALLAQALLDIGESL